MLVKVPQTELAVRVPAKSKHNVLADNLNKVPPAARKRCMGLGGGGEEK
jgi:hypothetical protein